MTPFVLVGVACFSLLGLLGCSSAGERNEPRGISRRSIDDDRSWLDGPQIYTNLGVSLDMADRLGVTVNGLWNGWGVKKPVASMHPSLLLWRLKKDAEYVAKFHEAGLLHGSTLSCAYAPKSVVGGSPGLTGAVCRSIDGKTFVMDGGWYLGKQPFMCQNAPAWQAELLGRAERIADAGSDALVLDEPFGETFFAAVPFPGFPGFSDFDMEALAKDIEERLPPQERKDRFGTEELTPSAIRALFSSVTIEESGGGGSDPSESPVGRLWLYYQAFQRRENFRTKKALVDAIREYSRKSRGDPLPIGANLAELDGYSAIGQLPVLYMAELFDFLAYEAAYRYAPEKREGRKGAESFVLSERGKWLPLHALGEAIVGPYRSLAYPSQELVESWMEPGKKINYLCHLTAEAYAARAGLIIPMWDFREKDLVALGRYTRFIRMHPDFYADLTPVAPVGVVYAHGEASPPQHWSYLGAAQALYESGLPFSVIYSSAEGRLGDGLSRARLRSFRVVALPILDALTPEQRAALTEYVGLDGGTVVLFRGDSGFPLPAGKGRFPFGNGAFVVMDDGTQDGIGRAYFTEYSDELRSRFAAAVVSALDDGSPVDAGNPDRKWALLAYAQGERRRAVLHVINYAYDPDEDRFEPQRDVAIRLKVQDYGLSGTEPLRCGAYAPERADPSAVPVLAEADGYARITLPELGPYEVLVLE